MDRDKQEHVQELMDEVARELGYEWEERKAGKRDQPPSGSRRSVLWIVLIVVAAIAGLTLVLHAGKNSGNNEAHTKALEVKLHQLDNRISALEKAIQSRADLSSRLAKLESQFGGLETSLDSLSARLDKLTQQARASTKKTKLNKGKTRGIKIHIVRRGDTLYRIASRYGVKAKSICIANGITLKTTLHPGQKLTIPSR